MAQHQSGEPVRDGQLGVLNINLKQLPQALVCRYIEIVQQSVAEKYRHFGSPEIAQALEGLVSLPMGAEREEASMRLRKWQPGCRWIHVHGSRRTGSDTDLILAEWATPSMFIYCLREWLMRNERFRMLGHPMVVERLLWLATLIEQGEDIRNIPPMPMDPPLQLREPPLSLHD